MMLTQRIGPAAGGGTPREAEPGHVARGGDRQRGRRLRDRCRNAADCVPVVRITGASQGRAGDRRDFHNCVDRQGFALRRLFEGLRLRRESISKWPSAEPRRRKPQANPAWSNGGQQSRPQILGISADRAAASAERKTASGEGGGCRGAKKPTRQQTVDATAPFDLIGRHLQAEVIFSAPAMARRTVFGCPTPSTRGRVLVGNETGHHAFSRVMDRGSAGSCVLARSSSAGAMSPSGTEGVS